MPHRNLQRPTVHLRRASSDDIGWLAEFGEYAFRTAYSHLIAPAEVDAYCAATYGVSQQTEELARADSAALIAELEDRRVGFVWIVRLDRSQTPECIVDPNAINLSRIYVDPAAQSLGIGSQLVEGAVTEARGLGGESIWLAVWTLNPRAVVFYQRHGFAEVGRTGFPTDPDPECDLVMARWLGACC